MANQPEDYIRQTVLQNSDFFKALLDLLKDQDVKQYEYNILPSATYHRLNKGEMQLKNILRTLYFLPPKQLQLLIRILNRNVKNIYALLTFIQQSELTITDVKKHLTESSSIDLQNVITQANLHNHIPQQSTEDIPQHIPTESLKHVLPQEVIAEEDENK